MNRELEPEVTTWVPIMNARVCGECDVIYWRAHFHHRQTCPRCGNVHSVPLARWLRPLRDDNEPDR